VSLIESQIMKTKLLKKIRKNYLIVKSTTDSSKYVIVKRWGNILPIWIPTKFYIDSYISITHAKMIFIQVMRMKYKKIQGFKIL
jgi:hypothetical protein